MTTIREMLQYFVRETSKDIFTIKNKIITIFKDHAFLIFSALVFGNLFGQQLGYSIWWTAKYSAILMVSRTSYYLIKKGNSATLVTAIIGSILTAFYLFLL